MLGRGLEDAQRVKPEVLHAEQVRRHDRDAQRAREGHRVDACAVRVYVPRGRCIPGDAWALAEVRVCGLRRWGGRGSYRKVQRVILLS